MPYKLTPKLIRKLLPEENSQQIERLSLPSRDISEVGSLSSCPRLIRLDLSSNSITDASFAASCQQLKWLSLAGNPVTDLHPLQCLTNLQVLNVGHAKLAGDVYVGGLTSLGALIVNDNRITSLSGLERLPALNTIVAKHNAIGDLGDSLRGCSALQKLSMAHNELTELGSCLAACTGLKELRLNHNRISALPPDLALNAQLRILDLSHNAIARVAALKVLAKLPWLRSLSLRGCALAERPDYPASVPRLLPDLDVLDDKRRADRPHGRRHVAATAASAGVPDQRGGAASLSGQPPAVQRKRSQAAAGRSVEKGERKTDLAAAPLGMREKKKRKLAAEDAHAGPTSRKAALEAEQHLGAKTAAAAAVPERTSGAAAEAAPPASPAKPPPVVAVFEAQAAAAKAAADCRQGSVATGAAAAALLASGAVGGGAGSGLSWDKMAAAPVSVKADSSTQPQSEAKRMKATKKMLRQS